MSPKQATLVAANVQAQAMPSSLSCSLTATATAAAKMQHSSWSSLSAKHVPIFKNPQQDSSGSRLCMAKEALAAAKTKDQQLLKPLQVYPSQLILKKATKPNLVFLQKKGSQIPNPNIISYSFPGSKPQNNKVAGMNKLVLNTNNVYKLLLNFFKSMYCLISKPVFITTPDKIKIQLFYFLLASGKAATASGYSVAATNKINSYSSTQADITASHNQRGVALNLTKVYPYKFKLICTVLSKFFNKNVELELIRLHQPYYNSNILVNFLALIINKKNIGACIQRLYNSNIIKANKASNQRLFLMQSQQLPKATMSSSGSCISNLAWLPQEVGYQHKAAAYLSGLNIKISGRLMREPIIPRITTKKFEKGFTAKGKINYFDLARFTHKNRKGAFTITVKSGQNF